MSKTVLIARPHTFIVSVMKPFLEGGGYATHKLEQLGDLPTRCNGISGAVISLALSSAITESAETVFLELRKVAPRVPVLFASMLSLEQARPALMRIAKQAGFEAAILGADASVAATAQLGQAQTLVYLSKADLESPERQTQALRVIQRHFR